MEFDMKLLLQVVIDHLGDRVFRGVADQLLLDDSILEKEERGDTPNIVF
jgi:hypothetical protein